MRGYISEHVASPITFGFWRPIVLVPAWFFTGMSAEQCDAILLHELAHIRRHDYISNILQIVIKTVFFYHPAVQYISKMVDTDREHACDDFAVHLTRKPESLATALGTVRLKAARSGGVLALAADGPDTPLMHRLKRLVGVPTQQISQGSARSAAATVIAISTATALLALGASNSQAHPTKQDEAELAGASPNIVERNLRDNTAVENNQGHVEFITVHGQTYRSGATGISTHIEVDNDNGKRTYIINGKEYSPKYSYDLFSKDGQAYVVKEKNNKRYIEINGSWHQVNQTKDSKVKYNYGHTSIGGQSYKTKTNIAKNQTFIKVRGQWYDIDETNLDTLIPSPVAPVPPVRPERQYNVSPTTPVSPSTNYSYGDGSKDAVKSAALMQNKNAVDDGYVYSNITKDHRIVLIKTNRSSGLSYVKQDSEWQQVKNKWEEGKRAPSKVKIKGHWYPTNGGQQDVHVDVDTHADVNVHTDVDVHADGSAMALAEAPYNNYWISEQKREETEARIERANERREAAFERAQEQREAALERAAERRDREWERAQEQRDREQEARDRKQEQRDHAQEARDRAQEQRDRATERADRKRDKVQTTKYENMRDRLIPALQSDGYLSGNSTTVKMELTSDDIFINGIQLPSEAEGKYCKIISESGMRKKDMKTIIIRPNSFDVTSSGKRGNHRVTIGTFEHGDN